METMPRLILLLLATFLYHNAISQCNITYSGAPCVETTFQFFCNSNNGVEHYWTFNGYDSIKLNCNAEYSFNSPGKKQISLRVKDAQGNICRDTISISIGEVVAHMLLSQSRPKCTTIIEAIDSSNIFQDPYDEQDSIIKWSYQWYENSQYHNKSFNKYNEKFTVQLNHNGQHPISLATESKFGCKDTTEIMIFIPGPIPNLDTMVGRLYCKNQAVPFFNLSRYNIYDSCIWTWDFGDNHYANQYDFYTKWDTIWHQYSSIGEYNILLNLNYSIVDPQGKRIHCNQVFPDTAGINLNPFNIFVNECGNASIQTQSISKIINVYPNPASHSIQIQGIENQKFFLINSLGIAEYFFTIGTNDMINIEHLPEGLYLLTDAHFKVLDKVVIAR
jgi:hypothetical protein